MLKKAGGLLQGLRAPGDSLRARVFHAGFWAFALRVFSRALSLVRIVVLARLLAPTDFGLFGIALLALSTLETFSHTGFEAALVQKKSDIGDYLDTAWVTQAVRGCFLAVVLFVVAPIAAGFFEQPLATPLVRALGLGVLFSGLANVGVVRFQKDLEFHKRFLLDSSGTAADLMVSIGAAVILRSAWALVLGFVAASFVRLVVSYLLHPYRPRMRFRRSLFHELFGFGKWVFGTTILVFVATQGDDIFVGKVLGAASLGLYQVAYRISNMMSTEVTHVISLVSFPAYARLQEATARLRSAFLQAFQLTVALSLPLTIGILFLGADFVLLFMGDRWVEMIPLLELLAVAGFIRSVVATGGPAYLATGRPRVDFWKNAVRVAILVALIYPLTALWGLSGTAVAVIVSILGTAPVWWYFLGRVIGFRGAELIAALKAPAVGSVVLGAVILSARAVQAEPSIIGFLATVLVAGAGYSVVQLLFWRHRYSSL